MNKQIGLLLVIVILLCSCSKDKLEDVQISNEETIFSKIVNDDYPLYYFLPPDYTNEEQYPVLYLLDGDWHTERVAREINQRWKENRLPKCILVGIGNSNERGRDYVYPEDKYNEGFGHADKFHEFIKTELIPHVESKYSVDTTSRFILGHSAGGFFVLYSMFSDTNPRNPLFHGYIAISPSIHWVNGYLFGMEQEMSERTNYLQCSVFIAVGSDEDVATNVLAEEMYDRLLDRNYTGLDVHYKTLNDKAHEGASIPGLLEGLETLFN